jgi:hypothetical protein
MSERSTCAHCGKPIILGPWFLDGRLPNPSIWTHVGSGRTCTSKAKDWKRPDWPSAQPSMLKAEPEPRGEISVESALRSAEAYLAALAELYLRLQSSGDPRATESAQVAVKAARALVKDLRGARLARPASSEETSA